MDRCRYITLRQREIYEWMKEFLGENQRVPTLREIARHFKMKAHNAVSIHIQKIVDAGMLCRVPYRPGCGYSPYRFPKETFKAILASC